MLPLVTALIWGTAFAAQDVCADSIPAFTFNTLRFFIAVVFLALVRIVIKAARKKGSAVPPDREQRRRRLRTLIVAGALCGIALGIASNLQQAGMEAGTDSGKSGFITALYVVLVPVAGLFLKKRVPGIFWAGLALAVAGLYLLCVSSSFTLTPGDALTLVCAVAFTAQILLIDRFARDLEPISFCIAEFIAAGLLSAVGMAVFEKPEISGIVSAILPLLYVAVFSSGVAYLFQIVAQRDGDPAVVSLLFSMEAVFSVIAGAVFLHQRMTAREYAGCALVFAAVIISQLPEKRKE